MNFSIFDLYGEPAKRPVKVRQPYTYAKLPEAEETPASPDSVEWEDTLGSSKALPALPPDGSSVLGKREQSLEKTFSSFPPELYLDTEEDNKKGRRTSVYGPMRFWPMSRRPSRNFIETYSYVDNVKYWKHLRPAQPAKAVERKTLNASASHPVLNVPKPRLKRSFPLEQSRSSIQPQASEAQVIRRKARHQTVIALPNPAEPSKLRPSLNLTLDAGKKSITLPKLNNPRAASKKHAVRRTL